MDLGIFFLSLWVNSLSQLNGMVMLRSAALGAAPAAPQPCTLDWPSGPPGQRLGHSVGEWTPPPLRPPRPRPRPHPAGACRICSSRRGKSNFSPVPAGCGEGWRGRRRQASVPGRAVRRAGLSHHQDLRLQQKQTRRLSG